VAGGDEDNFIFAQLRLVALVSYRPVLKGAVAMAFAVIFVKVGVVDARGAGVGVFANFAEGLASFAICAVEELVIRAPVIILGQFVDRVKLELALV